MANPTVGDARKLNELGRYLLGVPRAVSEFLVQRECREFAAYSEPDWGRCRRTPRSLSGGAIARGGIHGEM